MTEEVKVPRARKMGVFEVFPAIQGEGMVIGRKTMFIRTANCDYSCVWCDSAFTWDGSEKPNMMTGQEVFDWLEKEGTNEQGIRNYDHVTISGGNPALIKQPMSDLFALLKEHDIKIGLETQGSFFQEWFYEVDDLTISPKPPSSTMVTDFGKLDAIVEKLEQAGTNYTLKVVIFNDEDFEYAKKVHNRYPNKEFYVSVGNIDAYEGGDISGRLLKDLGWLWDKVMADPEANSFRPLPQLHTLVYANKRGV